MQLFHDRTVCTAGHMTNEERKIYDMVVRRFLSVLYPPAVYEQVSMEGTAAGETFAASGRIVKSAGWREVYEGGCQDEEEEEADRLKDQKLPALAEGQILTVESASLTNGQTKPPARFTEATLLGSHGESGPLYGKPRTKRRQKLWAKPAVLEQ